MVRKFLIALLCIVAQDSMAQKGTFSPYSFFGIGEPKDRGTVENQAMGGLSIYGDSIHINLRNPATYSQLKRTTYTSALSHVRYSLEDIAAPQDAFATYLEYLALGFPISQNVGVGFGLASVSSVGYTLLDKSTNTTRTLTGEGGLSRAYLSAGFAPLEHLSLGATVNFNFGTLEHQSRENVQPTTIERLESRINGFNFTGAINYTPRIKEKYTLYTSVVVNTQANLVSENSEQQVSLVSVDGEETEVVEDVDLDAVNLRNTTLKIPTKTTLGLGFGENKKWFLGAEYSFQSASNTLNDFLRRDNVDYNNASTYALGGYFIPDYQSLSNYLKRITYRAGLRYAITGLEVDKEAINDFGITFGFGLPLSKNFSNLNLGFELGRRGTTQVDFGQENYLKINIGLSLNDKWFTKRKID